eukprot:15455898-Alexandrium_andersonii.AAC.1
MQRPVDERTAPPLRADDGSRSQRHLRVPERVEGAISCLEVCGKSIAAVNSEISENEAKVQELLTRQN